MEILEIAAVTILAVASLGAHLADRRIRQR